LQAHLASKSTPKILVEPSIWMASSIKVGKLEVSRDRIKNRADEAINKACFIFIIINYP
jgi:hypothetical protein